MRRRACSALVVGVLWLTALPAARAGDTPALGEAAVSPAEGGSSTPFTLRLPAGAACPGDSADDGYRVNSYMVPASVDVATLPFDGLGPTPIAYGSYDSFREPLFDLETNSYASAQTADAELPGDPGTIINVPAFSYGVYTPGDLPAGQYHIGIACTLANEVVTIWDTLVVVTEAGDDEPAQIRWRAADAAGDVAGSGSGGPMAAGIAVALVAVLAVIGRRRHLSRPAAPSLEDS